MDPTTISHLKPFDYEVSNNIIDPDDNEIYSEIEEIEDEEDNSTFRNKTKKLIRPEKSACIKLNKKRYNLIFVSYITLHIMNILY